MSLITLKVTKSLNRWAVTHNQVNIATFATKPEADRAALALGVHHPNQDTVEVDLTANGDVVSEIRIF